VGPAYGVLGGGAGDHQAGGGEDAVAVGAFDGVVDGFGEAEVVGGDDEMAGQSTARAQMAGSSPAMTRSN
jgi:hypothetical protein